MHYPKPNQIIDAMMHKDLFSQWLGIERLEEGEGHCTLRMIVRPDMCNGFEIAHGGVSYSLADSALAFASNSRGKHAFSIETSISHIAPVRPGDILIAEAKEINSGNRIGIYEVTIHDQSRNLIALFRGTVFRKDQQWLK